jgi:integrase
MPIAIGFLELSTSPFPSLAFRLCPAASGVSLSSGSCLGYVREKNVRLKNRFTAVSVSKIKQPGMHHDGGGLYLQVTVGAGNVINRSWTFRFMLDGKARKMGLGSADLVSLAEARERAMGARRAVRIEHVDPIEARRAARQTERAVAARAMTFQRCAEAYIAAHEASWTNARHRQQWPETLQAYAYPVLGPLPVASIDTALVMKVIEPLWATKQETAARLRARIERVLDWATVSGYRQGENPARLKGHLDHLLAKRNKTRTVRHLAAMPPSELPGFMDALRQRAGTADRALEFCVLTAARTGEVLGARWAEIDLAARLWTIPVARMKSAREHRVPLSDRAVAILAGLPRNGDCVFEGHRDHRALLTVLHRMGRRDLTVHGFRATFKTWASEQTAFPSDVIEAALAHVVGDKVERAYARGDLLQKRIRLLAEWAAYCASPAPVIGDVVPLRRRI